MTSRTPKKRRSVHSKVRRVREHVYLLAVMLDPPCYVCGEKFDHEAFTVGDAADGLVWHHVSMQRENDADDDPKNLALCHQSCHRKFHIQYEQHENDIRDRRAVKYWGKTPNTASCKSRRGGSIKRTRT
jgi:hypothetical protein